MAHTSREEKGIVIFILEGKIMGTQHDNYQILDKVYEYTEKNQFNVVFDFTNLEWMNSRGIGICVTTITALRNRGGDLKLACLNEKMYSLLDKMKLFKLFESFDTVEDAINSFG